MMTYSAGGLVTLSSPSPVRTPLFAGNQARYNPAFYSKSYEQIIFYQVGQVDKKSNVQQEQDQKMAENKVTVIHKIGFKVIYWNNLRQPIQQFDRTVRSGLFGSQWTRTKRSWRWAIRSAEPMCGTWT